jgi:hypothetical protein
MKIDSVLKPKQMAWVRLEHGVARTLDVLQARQVLDTANAQIPDLERQIGQTEDAINILLGKYPGDVSRGQALGIETPDGRTWNETLLPQLPAGLPSELRCDDSDMGICSSTARIKNRTSSNCAPQGLQMLLYAPLYAVENTCAPTFMNRLLTEWF